MVQCSFSVPQSIRHDREQDDDALDGLFPIRLDVEMRERRVHVREQQQAGKDAPQIAAPAANRHAADDRRGDGFQLQAVAGGRLHLRRLHDVHHAASPASAPMNTKTPNVVRCGSMPASRAASASVPTA